MASPPGFRAAYLLLALLLLTLSVSACDCGMHCPYFTARQCLRCCTATVKRSFPRVPVTVNILSHIVNQMRRRELLQRPWIMRDR
ncbi:hypothetical protein QR680_009543 [Steinernema hermaphroditum]|uniref:Uncharacterized protein n=1 Tax=Steinernema hermaphroditum TaxID=289476 RepID=A0AA39M9M7_9BILA|nr:hypothetical protein QR680_009543 [Steinernema hermaphroditum]